MGEKRYYWLKLEKGFFDDKLIKKLRNMAGGDTYCIIYLRLILESMNNNGSLYFDGVEGTFSEELALVLDEQEENVQALLAILIATNRAEMISEEELQMLDFQAMTGSEASSTRRSRKSRNTKEALHCNTNATECNKIATQSKRREELEKEKELDIEIYKEKEEDIQHPRDVVPLIDEDVNLFVDTFNGICVDLPKCTKVTDKRKKAIKMFLKVFNHEEINIILNNARDSDFLNGQNERAWKAGIDWIIKPTNAVKVLDGNYENREKPAYKNPFDFDL